jgi:hypothetical protein
MTVVIRPMAEAIYRRPDKFSAALLARVLACPTPKISSPTVIMSMADLAPSTSAILDRGRQHWAIGEIGLNRRKRGETRACVILILVNRDVVNAGGTRTLPGGLHHRSDGPLGARCYDLDSSIDAVAHPAAQSEFRGDPHGPGAVADPLDLTGDDQAHRLHIG